MSALASLPAAVGGAVIVAVAVLLLAFAAIWVVEWAQEHIERGREAKAMADERDANEVVRADVYGRRPVRFVTSRAAVVGERAMVGFVIDVDPDGTAVVELVHGEPGTVARSDFDGAELRP